MATQLNILAWKIPWQSKLAGYSPWGCKESDMTEHTNTHKNLFILQNLEILVLNQWFSGWANPVTYFCTNQQNLINSLYCFTCKFTVFNILEAFPIKTPLHPSSPSVFAPCVKRLWLEDKHSGYSILIKDMKRLISAQVNTLICNDKLC